MNGGEHRIAPKAVIVASGGFQADTRLADAGLGAGGTQFPDPRHAL